MTGKPGASAVRRYSPPSSEGNENMPSLSVRLSIRDESARRSRRMVAPGTALPCGSVMAPENKVAAEAHERPKLKSNNKIHPARNIGQELKQVGGLFVGIVSQSSRFSDAGAPAAQRVAYRVTILQLMLRARRRFGLPSPLFFDLKFLSRHSRCRGLPPPAPTWPLATRRFGFD